MPPQRIHLFDGWVPRPFVYGVEGKRNQVTLAMEHVQDRESKHYIKFFVSGHEYKLLGLFKTDLHLMGADSEEGMHALRPLGTDKLGRDVFSRLMYGDADFNVHWSGGRCDKPVPGNTDGWAVGFQGRLDGLYHPESHRVPARDADYSRLAGARGGGAAGLVGCESVFRYLSHNIADWLDDPGAGGQGRFLAMREEDFVTAAQLYGSGQLRVIFRHMLPSFMSHIIATTTLAIPAIIIAETSLSFLGLGLRQPAISWGVLLFEAQNLQAVANAPWLLTPGLFVIFAVLTLNFMGDGTERRGGSLLCSEVTGSARENCISLVCYPAMAGIEPNHSHPNLPPSRADRGRH